MLKWKDLTSSNNTRIISYLPTFKNWNARQGKGQRLFPTPKGPGRKLGNLANHGNYGDSTWTRELQILAIKIKKDKRKRKFHKVWKKIPCKIKIFRDFRVFVFWGLYPKMKTRKSWKFYKNAIILWYENVASKTLDMFFKSHQTKNYSPIFPIRYQVFVF